VLVFFVPFFGVYSRSGGLVDNKEAFVDPSRDESLIFELLDLKNEVDENGSAAWFLQDLANEQDAQQCTVSYLILVLVVS
ncbi:hypothetical protein J0J30_23680, partial [Vibrio vulnificus]|nr:hypothetical protein [Vibrio vulnificus]